jgi:hypothetical protein
VKKTWLVVGAAVLLVAAITVAVLALSRTPAPADRADAFVPENAIAYLHVSTDPDRETDRELFDRLRTFPSFAGLRERVETALNPNAGAFDLDRDVRAWLGDEAAVAVMPGGVLILLSVAKQDTAQGVLTRVAGAKRGVEYRDVLIQRFSGGAAAFFGGFLILGPEPLVRQSIDLHAGKGRSLARLPDYARAAEDRPDDRAADAWAGPDAAFVLPDRIASALAGHRYAASLLPVDDGLQLLVRRLGGAGDAGEFDPQLIDTVPKDALAYVGLRGVRALGPLLPPAAGAAGPEVVAAVQPLLDVLTGEVALSITPAAPDPITTLTARTKDPAAARAALAGLQGVIAQTLVGSEDNTGAVTTFQERTLAQGLDAYVLTLAGGGELAYAVVGSKVIISNADDGVLRAARGTDGIQTADAFERVIKEVPDPAEALAFLDASQLLDLADAAGLDASATYRATRPDLRKLRAVGATVRRQGNDITTELNLTIP